MLGKATNHSVLDFSIRMISRSVTLQLSSLGPKNVCLSKKCRERNK